MAKVFTSHLQASGLASGLAPVLASLLAMGLTSCGPASNGTNPSPSPSATASSSPTPAASPSAEPSTSPSPSASPVDKTIAIDRPETAGVANTLSISSSAFGNGASIPDRYSAYGDNLSPSLAWSGLPAGTQTVAMLTEDPDAKTQLVIHWLIANIPASQTSLPENLPKEAAFGEALQGTNVSGNAGYMGPRPPAGDPAHHYHFQFFALDTKLNLSAGYNRQNLLDAMKGHILAKGEIVGLYQRQP